MACARRRGRERIDREWLFSVHHRFPLLCAGDVGGSHTVRDIDVEL